MSKCLDKFKNCVLFLLPGPLKRLAAAEESIPYTNANKTASPKQKKHKKKKYQRVENPSPSVSDT